MADNVAITPGVGATIATDQVTIDAVSVHAQRIKPILGASGAYVADLGGRAVGSDGVMYVDPRLLRVRVTQTPTVSTSPAYTAKDAVGGLLTFANAVRVSGGTGTIELVTIVDKGQQMAELDLVLFDRTFTASSDNAVFAPSDADLLNHIATIPIGAGTYADFSTNSVATVPFVVPIVLNGTSLFGQLVTRGTPTYTSTTDIVVYITITQD